MPARKWNLTGRRFRFLLAISEAEPARKVRRWLCRCDCGNEITYYQSSLLQDKAHSCGCKNIQKFRSTIKQSHLAEWYVWRAMKQRCNNPHNKRFADYGGRGIKVCERWLKEFHNFLADMGPRPSSDHQIDRYPDNDGDYEPSNCRWATCIEQATSRRNVWKLTINGETKSLAEWASQYKLHSRLVRQRIVRDGMTPEQALSQAAGFDDKPLPVDDAML